MVEIWIETQFRERKPWGALAEAEVPEMLTVLMGIYPRVWTEDPKPAWKKPKRKRSKTTPKQKMRKGYYRKDHRED